ncbi:hypothetical protein ACFWCF_24330 [Rhodococcus sp. NPDC060090]|uniref:hypothetical protein n=1 Tax=Rhodococcus sp. NPDC060090 TaxID=3347056 RepID=UPI0036551BB8
MVDADAAVGTAPTAVFSPAPLGVHFSTEEIKRRIDAMFGDEPSGEVQAGEL